MSVSRAHGSASCLDVGASFPVRAVVGALVPALGATRSNSTLLGALVGLSAGHELVPPTSIGSMKNMSACVGAERP